jgi:hypothetical protein
MNWLTRRFADRPTPLGNFMRARSTVVALLLALASVAFLPLFAAAQSVPAAAPSSLTVKVVPGLTAEQQAEIVARNGGTITSSHSRIAPGHRHGLRGATGRDARALSGGSAGSERRARQDADVQGRSQ